MSVYIEKAVRKTAEGLPFGIIRGWECRQTNARYYIDESLPYVVTALYGNGDSIEFIDLDSVGDLVAYKVAGPAGEILDLGVLGGVSAIGGFLEEHASN